MFFAKIDILFSVSALPHRFFEQLAKSFSKLGQIDPVLRPFRSGDTRLHVREIQIDIDAVIDFAPERHAEHFLGSKIIFERQALFLAAASSPQVIHRLLINWKISHGRAVLGRHVSNRGAIRHRKRCGAFAIKLDKFADHFLRAQQLRDVQDEIRRGNALAQLPAHVHAHHFRRQKINRLPKHAGFRFNATHAPANHAKTVNHGRVGIRADKSVGQVNSRWLMVDSRLSGENSFREIFEIHLMHNPNSRRNELKSFKGLLSPF